MTLFYGTYDDCQYVSAGALNMSEIYEDARKYLKEIGNTSPLISFKTWTSPERITTVEYGDNKEFYVIKKDVIPPVGKHVSMRMFERVD